MEPRKKSIYKSWGYVSHAHTHIHVKQSYCPSTVCRDLRSWVRSFCNNLSRIKQCRQSCDICEHCVPVNVITHYPLSLPAQAEWLQISLSLSLSLNQSPPLSLRLCHIRHWCLFVMFSGKLFSCSEITWMFLWAAFIEHSALTLTAWSIDSTLQLLFFTVLIVTKSFINDLQNPFVMQCFI